MAEYASLRDAISPYNLGRKGSAALRQLVETFAEALSLYPIGSYLRLDTGEIAQVVEANPGKRAEPKIQIVADANQNLLENQPIIDLSRAESVVFEPIFKP